MSNYFSKWQQETGRHLLSFISVIGRICLLQQPKHAEVAISASSLNAEINLQLKKMQQAINKTVAKMPPKMQEVYKLSRQKHLSYKEISDYMSISVETVKKHIHHTRNLIKNDMAPYFFIFIILVFFFLH